MNEERKQWIREAVADTFAEEYVRELIEALEDAEDRAENWRTAYIDSVKAMLVAAGAPEDIDAMEAEVRACGTKPSHYVAKLKADRDRLREVLGAEIIVETSAELASQDNAITADPIFIVEERERVYGVSRDYRDGVERVDGEPVGYVNRWRFVTAALTRRACEHYIAANGHNLNDPRIYVASAHRNREWIELRQWLLSLGRALGRHECREVDGD